MQYIRGECFAKVLAFLPTLAGLPVVTSAAGLDPNLICNPTTNTVYKTVLEQALAQQYLDSSVTQKLAALARADKQGRPPWVQAFVNDPATICGTGVPSFSCQTKIATLTETIAGMQRGTQAGFSAPAGVSVAQIASASDAEYPITCVQKSAAAGNPPATAAGNPPATSAGGKPPAPPAASSGGTPVAPGGTLDTADGAPPTGVAAPGQSQLAANSWAWLDNLELRGTPDTLWIAHTSNDFSSADSSSITFTDSGGTKRVDAMTATLGYRFRLYPDGNEVANGAYGDLVPFISANRNITTPATKTTVQTQVVDFGVQGTFLIPAREELANLINIRPNYQENLETNAAVAQLNLQYIPVFISKDLSLNSYAPLGSPTSPIWYRIAFEPRGDFGLYTDRGNTPAAIALDRDFARLGGQIGIEFTTFAGQFPLDFNILYTGLHSFAGVPKTISYFNPTARINLTQDKIFGINCSYANGVLPNTGQRQEMWSVALSAKY